MALELVRTTTGTMLMGTDKGAEVIATFQKLWPVLGPKIKSSPINLSARGKKGALVALVERAPHGKTELLTPTKARIFNTGKKLQEAIASGSTGKAVAGAAATWVALASNYDKLLAENPVLLVTAGKALVQETKIALQGG